MAKVFTWQFTVRSYELDTFGCVNTSVYHNYLENGATRASAEAGFAYDWYFEQRKAWVVRRMTIQYLSPLRYGDELELRTWVSDVRRILSHREYDLRRADGSPVVRARARWVYVNLDTMRPERIPAEAHPAFDPTGVLEPLDVRLPDSQKIEEGARFSSARRVQRYELDPAGHANNAVYLSWFEQALVDALESLGWTRERMIAAGLRVVQAAHEVDYLVPALEGARLRIDSQWVGLDSTRGAWSHRVVDEASGNLICEDYSVVRFVDFETGVPRALPEDLAVRLGADPL
jgi:acyl-CoA thioester hydrolase